MKMKHKKGVSVYISWILIMLLAVILSAIMYTWYVNRTKDATERLIKETTSEACNNIGIMINGVCQRTQYIKINITNVMDMRVDQIVFNFIDLYDYPETKISDVTIYPGETESMEIIKQGTLKQIEISPVMIIRGERYICSNRKVFKYRIAQC